MFDDFFLYENYFCVGLLGFKKQEILKRSILNVFLLGSVSERQNELNEDLEDEK